MLRWAGRWARRLALVAGLGVALLLGLQAVLSWALPLEELVAKWTPHLGVPAHVDSAGVRILPHPSVRLHGLRFENGGTIERLVVELELEPLLRGDIEGGRARIRGAHLALVRRKDGSVQIRALVKDEEKESVPEEDSGPAALAGLPRVEVRDLVLRYIDHTAGPSPIETDLYLQRVDIRTDHVADAVALEASGRLEVGAGPPAFDVSAKVDAPAATGKRPISVEIETRGLDPAPIVPHLPRKWGIRSATGLLDARVSLGWREGFEGKLDLHFTPGAADYAGVELGGEIRFEAGLHAGGGFRLTDGRVQAETASFEGIEASELEGNLSYAKRTVTLAPLGFRAWGGTAEARGTLRVGDPLGFQLDVDLAALSLYRLEHPGGAAPPEDPTRLDAKLEVEGHWEGGAGWLEPIQGSAEVSMNGGQVASGGMLDSLVVALGKGFERHRDDEAHHPYDTTALEGLTGSFAISDGRGSTQDLKVDTEDYEVTAAGWLDGVGGYQFDGAFAFTPKGLSRLLAAASVRGEHDSRGGLPKVPFRISGNLRDGTYRVHLVEQPLTAFVIVPWTVNEVADWMGDAAGAGREAVDQLVPKQSEPDGKADSD